MTATTQTASLSVGVIIAREPTDHPWQEFRWRPIEVVLGRPDVPTGDIVYQTEAQTQYYGGTLTIELHRKATSAYIVNLENEIPVVYVVMREAEDDASTEDALPYVVETVTVSPFDAQDYLDSGEDIVEPIAMPEPLIAWLEGFVANHHEEETFIKRKRDKLDIKAEKFGQEPLELIRQRQRRH